MMQPETFHGVRFFLFGFDPLNHSRVRSKLVSGGGVDAVQYSQNCTHVIVDRAVYDDPVCVAARNDGKVLVTALWVDHSLDIGMSVDPSSVMYWPPRDLKGIPGASSLVMCLTGYQRQDRDDIMNMVALMGAQFSKPLVASKVTHLICYKFEGEKYDLAKKLRTIKLVNHRWLEDCLRNWRLLPEEDYNKSGYELEVMEAQAKDSEDEDNGALKQASFDDNKKGSPNLEHGSSKTSDLLEQPRVEPKMAKEANEHEGPSSVVNANELLVTSSKRNNSNHDAASVGLLNPKETTPTSTKSGFDFGAENPCLSDTKLTSICYTRRTPQKSPVNFTKGFGDNRSSSRLLDKFMKVLPANIKQGTDVSCSGQAESSAKANQLPHNGESSSRTKLTDVSCTSSAQKSSPVSRACDRESPGVSSMKVLEKKCMGINISGSYNCTLLDGRVASTDDPVGMKLAQNSLAENLTPESSKLVKKSVSHNDDILNSKSGINNDTAADKCFSGCHSMKKLLNVLPKGQEPSNQQQVERDSSSCDRTSEIERSEGVGLTEVVPVESGNSSMKPGRKKMVGKKTLGSRPKLKYKANKVGSTVANAASGDPVMTCAKEMRNNDSVLDANCAVEVERVEAKNNNEDKADVIDEETEPPEDKDADQNVPTAHDKDPNEANKRMEMESEEDKHGENVLGTWMQEDETATKQRNGDQSTLHAEGIGSKIVKGIKRHSAKRKAQSASATTEILQPKELGDGKQTNADENVQYNAKDKAKGVSSTKGPTKKRNSSEKQSEISMEMEKENDPVDEDSANQSNSGELDGKKAVSTKKSSRKFRKINPDSAPGREAKYQVKADPMWFILSGHRFQRKEFQQLIKRLKGKCCRDAHQWSYQATHFIAPDPLRRTEKFFAAAASGRWILKTDYLAACSQSGRFLEEEPYEWHKNGLSEDGAINLEAPRKWRLLRERTGHGAFHGMRIVIYGECITPPLDTLKRVLKAGDGTILATSPPYTKFLSLGVDYAIISPGMLRVDMWVQEFLKHEIPCVLADYLVEYVCKPGYSLDKHVLYNTQAWAQESFNKLQRMAEETVEVDKPLVDNSDDDITCQVCGSTDRGDVMLICGDESGTAGCGIGTHIDCCDPPLEKVPEEDWFCTNCRGGKHVDDASKKRKKR